MNFKIAPEERKGKKREEMERGKEGRIKRM